MVRNLVVLGGSSHPALVQTICNHLGIPPAKVLLDKFSVGETRVEIGESVRGKDVYIIQSGAGGSVNDHLMELLIAISACKTASAKKVTAVLPLFPYSRQSELPYGKQGAPLARASNCYNKPDFPYTLESAPQTASQTPHPDHKPSSGLPNGGVDELEQRLATAQLNGKLQSAESHNYAKGTPNGLRHTDTNGSTHSAASTLSRSSTLPAAAAGGGAAEAEKDSNERKDAATAARAGVFQPQPGYKQWVAQAGTLVADLLTCAGADHIVTLDLHDAQYQGFFDIPVDNLYGRPLLKRYIQYHVPDYKRAAVIVSPDAGGAKRATAIAESLGMPFALIHKVSPPPRSTHVCAPMPPSKATDCARFAGAPADQDHGAPERDHDAGGRRDRPHRHPHRRHGRHVAHHHARGAAGEEGGGDGRRRADHARHPERRGPRAHQPQRPRQGGGDQQRAAGGAPEAVSEARGPRHRARLCRGKGQCAPLVTEARRANTRPPGFRRYDGCIMVRVSAYFFSTIRCTSQGCLGVTAGKLCRVIRILSASLVAEPSAGRHHRQMYVELSLSVAITNKSSSN